MLKGTTTLTVYVNGKNKSSPREYRSLPFVLQKITDNSLSLDLDDSGIDNLTVDEIVKVIRNRLSRETDNKLRLNLFGPQYGGAIAFLICQKLKDIDPNLLEINVCAFDPIPGNYMTTSYFDSLSGIKSTLSGQIGDLSACKNINNVLILFTNNGSNTYQAPILPIMPPQAKVTVDVLPDRDKNVHLYTLLGDSKLEASSDASAIAFHYVTRFLEENKTTLNHQDYFYEQRLQPYNNEQFAKTFRRHQNYSDKEESKLRNDAQLLKLLENENKKVKKANRSMHFDNRVLSEPKWYLNLLHKKLAVTSEQTQNTENYSLKVKNPKPQPSHWNGQKPIDPMISEAFIAAAAAGAFMSSGYPGEATLVTGTACFHLLYKYNKDKINKISKSSEDNKQLEEVTVSNSQRGPYYNRY